jgi:uncharacterized protein YjeT (DUF2065 family)
MELATQRLATVALLVIGLSHAVQCRAWARFFMMLREKGEAGVLANALLHFWPGLLIASFHDVWTGIPLILTVYGWLLVLKGTLYLLWPPIWLRAMSLVSEANARKFAIAGVPLIAFGFLLGWDLLGSPTAPVAH